MGIEELQCFFDAAKPTDVFICLSVSNGVPVWNIVFLGLLTLSIVGWGMGTKKFDYGLMIGGFLTSLVGIPMFAMNLIAAEMIMLSLIFCIAGVIIAIVQGSSKD